MKRKRYIYFTKSQIAIRIFLLLILSVALVLTITDIVNSRQDSVIPNQIKKRVSYQVYVPDTVGSEWTVSKDSVKYDSKQGVLSLTVTSPGNSLYISEQNTPSQFTDIPQYFPALLAKLNQYAEVQSSLGSIALTHPKEFNGGQTAILNTNGTLMFVRAQNDLTNVQWQKFFNTLEVIR